MSDWQILHATMWAIMLLFVCPGVTIAVCRTSWHWSDKVITVGLTLSITPALAAFVWMV